MTVLDWHIATTDIPRQSLSACRVATMEERSRIAEELSLVRCDALKFEYKVVARAGGRYEMHGQISADVTQECVVSLEPVEARLSIPVDVEFEPAPEQSGETDDRSDDDKDIDLSERDLESIENGRLNIGRIVVEELASGIDPYPRKQDASFEWQEKAPATPDNPFAKLAVLKPKPDKP